MRSKALIPIGQGCKPVTLLQDDRRRNAAMRCECHPTMYLNICVECLERFHSAMPHTRTCSDKCRKRLSRSRHDKLFQMVLSYANGATA